MCFFCVTSGTRIALACLSGVPGAHAFFASGTPITIACLSGVLDAHAFFASGTPIALARQSGVPDAGNSCGIGNSFGSEAGTFLRFRRRRDGDRQVSAE